MKHAAKGCGLRDTNPTFLRPLTWGYIQTTLVPMSPSPTVALSAHCDILKVCVAGLRSEGTFEFWWKRAWSCPTQADVSGSHAWAPGARRPTAHAPPHTPLPAGHPLFLSIWPPSTRKRGGSVNHRGGGGLSWMGLFSPGGGDGDCVFPPLEERGENSFRHSLFC
jgi:hypothetical protein